MRRRVLVSTALAGIAPSTWAQQSPGPRIGYMSGRALVTDSHLLGAFREGLKRTDYIDGRNVTLDVRWADGQYDRFSVIAAELANSRPNVMVAVGGNAIALAAKAATSAIPIVFMCGSDPVELGLVSNLGRPDGNLTGMTVWAQELNAKRLELLREMLPNARAIALLMNPSNPGAAAERRQTQEAAALLGLKLNILNAGGGAEIERVFEMLPTDQLDALVVASDAYLINRRAEIVTLTAARRLPAIFPSREFAEAGGLVSYGSRWADMYRLIGVYAGRILKGARPADLPVQRPTTFELVINQTTAKTLGLALPAAFLARADEVIE